MSIQTNIAEIRSRIAAACAESGREAGEITLVGASKMNDAAACREAIAAGIDVLGENRVQEMTEKLVQHAYDGAPLHFIGHLQRNKVKQVVGKVALIQSVGSLPLLEAIEKEAEKQGIVQDILLEVNIGGEEAKSGFAPAELNTAYAKYFVGNSYLKPLTDPKETVFVANVTFEPGCRNNWHIHHAAKGGGQLLLCVDGEGWYQEAGKPARSLKPGDVVTIPAEVKHWHGAKADSWFSHLAVEVPGENTSNEWCEPVSDADYAALEN